MNILMRIFILLFSFISLCTTSTAQVELIHEFIEGPDGSQVFTDYTGTFNQAVSVKLGDETIVFSAKGEFGLELYALNNGQISLIEDLKSGVNDSNPQFLTKFNGLIYFIADSDEGARIFQTDGTTSGTQIAFALGNQDTQTNDFSDILIGRDNRLYFEFDGIIYTYKDNVLTEIDYDHPLNVNTHFNANDLEWTLYKDGVVMFNLQDDKIYLLSIIDNQVNELSMVPYGGSFDDRIAIESFDGGVFFAIESLDDEVNGDYVYNEDTGEIKKIGSAGSYFRSDYIDEQSCIVAGYQGGTYLFNENHSEGIQIHNDNAVPFTGATWKRERLSNGMLFLGKEEDFGNADILFLEKNSTSSNVVHSTRNVSKWKTDGSYTFYFADSEVGDQFSDEDLFAFDHSTRQVSTIATIYDAAFNSDITPLGVIGEELYFMGKIDYEVGKELYKINIGFQTTSTLDNEPEELILKALGNQHYLIDCDQAGTFQVEVHHVDGRFLESTTVDSQVPFEVKSKGLIIISVYKEKQRKAIRVYH